MKSRSQITCGYIADMKKINKLYELFFTLEKRWGKNINIKSWCIEIYWELKKWEEMRVGCCYRWWKYADDIFVWGFLT